TTLFRSCRSPRESPDARPSWRRLGGGLLVDARRLRPLQQRKPEGCAALVICLSHATRERAHAQDVALPLGNGDRAARVEQIEGEIGRAHLLVSRQGELRGEHLLARSLM